MARESSITYKEVAEVSERLMAAGKKPSARLVRDQLGTGSMATVLRHLQQWRNEGVPTSGSPVPIDGALLKVLQRELDDRVGKASAEAAARYAELQGEADAVVAEAVRLEAVLKQRDIEIGELQALNISQLAQNNMLLADREQGRAALAAAHARIESLEIGPAKTSVSLAGIPGLEARILALESALIGAQEYGHDQARLAAEAQAKLAAAEARLELLAMPAPVGVSSTVSACGEEGSGLERKLKTKPASAKQESSSKTTYG